MILRIRQTVPKVCIIISIYINIFRCLLAGPLRTGNIFFRCRLTVPLPTGAAMACRSVRGGLCSGSGRVRVAAQPHYLAQPQPPGRADLPRRSVPRELAD